MFTKEFEKLLQYNMVQKALYISHRDCTLGYEQINGHNGQKPTKYEIIDLTKSPKSKKDEPSEPKNSKKGRKSHAITTAPKKPYQVKNGAEAIKCPNCRSRFKRWNAFKKHLQLHVPNSPKFGCICGLQFKTITELKKHGKDALCKNWNDIFKK